jgi:hypothetical protein
MQPDRDDSHIVANTRMSPRLVITSISMATTECKIVGAPDWKQYSRSHIVSSITANFGKKPSALADGVQYFKNQTTTCTFVGLEKLKNAQERRGTSVVTYRTRSNAHAFAALSGSVANITASLSMRLFMETIQTADVSIAVTVTIAVFGKHYYATYRRGSLSPRP